MKDLTGQRFGRLKVLTFSRTTKYREGVWKCGCDCGGIAFVQAGNLRSGGTKSCGCIVFKHGHTVGGAMSAEYNSWIGMKQRCENAKRIGYKYYGGRGISVCKRWSESFVAFLADMGEKPSPKHSIDRIDNDGDYEPGNCRWATRSQQQRNSRNALSDEDRAKAIELRQEGKTLKAIGDLLGVSHTTVRKITRAS